MLSERKETVRFAKNGDRATACENPWWRFQSHGEKISSQGTENRQEKEPGGIRMKQWYYHMEWPLAVWLYGVLCLFCLVLFYLSSVCVWWNVAHKMLRLFDHIFTNQINVPNTAPHPLTRSMDGTKSNGYPSLLFNLAETGRTCVTRVFRSRRLFRCQKIWQNFPFY